MNAGLNQPEKRILALDYGTVRIGVALSDERHVFATPLCVCINKKDVLDEIERIIEKNNVEKIIVGLPISVDGSDSPMTVRVRAFADHLHERTSLPVELYDERYTSLLAHDSLIASGKTRKARQKKGELDKRAAAILLQEYLDGNKA